MTRCLGRLFDTDVASQNDHIRDGCSGFARDPFEDTQNACQTLRFVAFPVFLGGETDARAVGTAAVVGLAEGPRAVPSGGHHVGDAQTACRNLGLDRVHVIVAVASRNRILPDQNFGRRVGADVTGVRAKVTVGQLEPCAGKAIVEVSRIGHELLADAAIDRVNLHRHVGIGHHRHDTLSRIGGIDRHVFFLDVDGAPLVRTGGRFGQFPFIAEQELEVAHVPFRRLGGPRAFDARCHGVGCRTVKVRVHPAEALGFNARRFGFGA